MPLYFAYGANMDADAMAGRCPGAKPLGVARLPRHRFFVTRDGYASVARDPRETVHGVLWELSLAHVRTLDRFEEVDRGLYLKITQPVIAEGGPKRALVYVGVATEAGPPRPGYLESVLASAEAWGLPTPYRERMARCLVAGKRHPGVFDPGERAAARPAVQPRAARPTTSVGAATRASEAWSWKP